MSKKDFDEFMDKLDALIEKENIKEAIELIENSLNEYPENTNEMKLDLAMLNLKLGNSKKTLEILNFQLDKGIWYPKVYHNECWNLDEFKGYIERWEKLKNKSEINSEGKLYFYKPINYDKNKSYPLFIAFHGWGEDVNLLRKYWNSSKLSKEYIVAVPQSSQIVGYSNYCWNNLNIAYNEIKEAYDEVIWRYSIDTNTIIVGGFSQGATLALDVILNMEYIPAKGFIALNPDKPKNFSNESIINSSKRGVKGVILTGDMDGDYEEQKEIVRIFNDLDYKCRFVVKENFGHWFPKDLDERIDLALEYILE